MAQVIIGVDPHKRSATSRSSTSGNTGRGRRFGTDRDGYQAMLAAGRQHPDRLWAVEGCNGIGRHVAQRLLADGETVVDVPTKLSARARVFATGQGRKTDPVDAPSVAVVALRTPGLRQVVADDTTGWQGRPVDFQPARETVLTTYGSGDQIADAVLSDGVVLKKAGPWASGVIALLHHLENVGFEGAPRVVGDGYAADGRLAVTYIPGESPHPGAWSEEAASRVGELLRQLHTATTGFTAPADAVWQHVWLRELEGEQRVIGHCDTGPWNIIASTGSRLGVHRLGVRGAGRSTRGASPDHLAQCPAARRRHRRVARTAGCSDSCPPSPSDHRRLRPCQRRPCRLLRPTDRRSRAQRPRGSPPAWRHRGEHHRGR